nr:hypothetical protein [Tanacetum cinerariifolium]
MFDDPYADNNGGTSTLDLIAHDENHEIRLPAYTVQQEAGKQKRYAEVRAQNQDLLMTISELKTKLSTIEKGKNVNTKFDSSETLEKHVCVTTFNKHIADKAMNASNTKDNSDMSKPVTLQSTPKREQGHKHNENVITRGMYKINKQDTKTSDSKASTNVSNLTGVGSSHSVKLEQFQVNIKFLNTLPPEWSKFVTDVKLVQDLHTTNIDHIHAYLGQYEFHANEVRLMHERNSYPLALVATHQMTQGDKFLLLRVLLEPTHQEQVEAILGNKGLLFITTAKEKDTCPNSVLNLKGNGMILGLRIKCFCSINSLDPSPFCRPTKVKVPKELPKVGMESFQSDNSVSNQSALNFDQYFELNELKAQSQKKDTVITKLKERIKSLSRNVNKDKVKKDIDEIETINIELDHRVSKTAASASGSQPSGNTKKDRIQRPPSSTQKNKVEVHPRTVKSSLKNKNYVIIPKGTAIVQHSKLNANSELTCVKCNGCMLSDNHDLCVLNVINDVNARFKSKSVKKNSKRKV